LRKNIHKTTAFKLPLKLLLRSPAVEVLGVSTGVCARVMYHATAMVALAVDRTQLERLGAGVDDAVVGSRRNHTSYRARIAVRTPPNMASPCPFRL